MTDSDTVNIESLKMQHTVIQSQVANTQIQFFREDRFSFLKTTVTTPLTLVAKLHKHQNRWICP